MKKERILRTIRILLILAAIILCDQLSKNIIRQKIEYNERISIIDDFITMTKVENTGAFLSLGNHLPKTAYIILMILAPLIVISYAFYYLLHNNNLPKTINLALCLIVGGGLGNLIDRVLYGSVTDFLHFNFVIFQTGIVNLADITLTTGFFILFIRMAVDSLKKEKKPESDKQFNNEQVS
jgi:signal peptidase II